jgi:ATP-binding cassette, subfamily B, bacterial PglK
MLKSLKELFLILGNREKVVLYRLQILVVLTAFCEVASIMTIGMFLSLMNDAGGSEGRWATIIPILDFQSEQSFLIFAGIVALIVIAVSSSISMVTAWSLSMFGARLGAQLAVRLYQYYLHKDWLFHVDVNSSKLTGNIAQECQRVSTGVIFHLLRINSKIVLVIAIFIFLLTLNPYIALFGICFFAGAYALLFVRIREKLSQYGESLTSANVSRHKLLNEGFGGIKDTLLLGRQDSFTSRFTDASNEMAAAQGKIRAISQVPRYAMESLAFGSVIIVVLVLLLSVPEGVESVFPVLSMYALAGLKLLPAFQQIYASASTLKGNIAAFENLKDDLRASAWVAAESLSSEQVVDRLAVRSEIALRNVSFRYPGSKVAALEDVSLVFPVKSVIGLVGESGSGKSTTVDILLGLTPPDSGVLVVDGEVISASGMGAWQNCLGYVSQSIFLADASIRENIAYGVRPEEIDEVQVARVLKLARLDDFIETLPSGDLTRVGERGVQLSGGQRQRVGIARALYHEAEVLVFDEATSALDTVTEDLIMEAIHSFSGSKTIIIVAHRLSTIERCDLIYLLDQGRIVGKGTYEQLSNENSQFRRLAKLV